MNSENIHRKMLLFIFICSIGVAEVYTNPFASNADFESINEKFSEPAIGASTNFTSLNDQNDGSTGSSKTLNGTTSDVTKPSDSTKTSNGTFLDFIVSWGKIIIIYLVELTGSSQTSNRTTSNVTMPADPTTTSIETTSDITTPATAPSDSSQTSIETTSDITELPESPQKIVAETGSNSSDSQFYTVFVTVLPALALMAIVLGVGYVIYHRCNRRIPHSVWYLVRPRNVERLDEDSDREQIHLT